MALAAPWIAIPARICTELGLLYEDALSVLELKPIQPHSRAAFKTEGEMVDMRSVIPATSTSGYPMYVDEYEEGQVPWLRIWYCHPRGAARQVTLRRYLEVAKLGRLLGQLQAEGDKRSSRVGFKNSAIAEHADLTLGLLELGVPSRLIHARCVFNPGKSSLEQGHEYAEQYRNATGIAIENFDAIEAMKGAIAADTVVRSSTLASILLSAMDEVRRGSYRHNSLRPNFLAKLLSGDGSLDVRRTPKRLDVRLTLVDRDTEALQDYAELLSQEGFKAKVHPERIMVRAYCTWLNLLRLYEIGAFKNGRNWVKLLCAIKITTQGRENRGYKRIQELSEADIITSDDVSAKYAVGRRSSNLWIHSMERKGLIENISTLCHAGRKAYRVTRRGKEIAKLLRSAEKDYDEITKQKENKDPYVILDETKRRGKTSGNRELKGHIFGPTALNTLKIERIGAKKLNSTE